MELGSRWEDLAIVSELSFTERFPGCDTSKTTLYLDRRTNTARSGVTKHYLHPRTLWLCTVYSTKKKKRAWSRLCPLSLPTFDPSIQLNNPAPNIGPNQTFPCRLLQNTHFDLSLTQIGQAHPPAANAAGCGRSSLTRLLRLLSLCISMAILLKLLTCS